MDKQSIEKLLLIMKTQQEIVNMLRQGNNNESAYSKKDMYTEFESKIKRDKTIISENLKHYFNQEASNSENSG